MSDRPAILVALNRELRCVRRAFPKASACARAGWCVSGIGPVRAERAARELLAKGHDTIACIGLAGGLSPRLAAGDVLVASALIDDAEETPPLDARWADAVSAHLADTLAVHLGALYSATKVVDTTAAKSDLAARTGALAVDMESAAVARVARECGVRMLALRVVADDHSQPLPTALLANADVLGDVRVDQLVPSLLVRPWLIIDAVRLGARVRRAERVLSAVLARLGPSLASRREGG